MTSKTLSLSGIAATCGLSRELVGAYLKQIFVKFIEQGRQGKLCQLDFEVGKLIAYPNGTLQFTEEPIFGDLKNDPRFIARDDCPESV